MTTEHATHTPDLEEIKIRLGCIVGWLEGTADKEYAREDALRDAEEAYGELEDVIAVEPAAPALLAALEAIVGNELPFPAPSLEQWQAARAALAQARGE